MTSRLIKEPKASSPENRRKTGDANLARGEAHRWKPGQSGNPGGRHRTARLSDACRAKLASPVPGDATGRTYAEAIADSLAGRALKGDIRAAQEVADRAEGRPGQNNPVNEADMAVKVIVMDIPRPIRGVVVPDVLAPVQPPKHAIGNGYKPSIGENHGYALTSASESEFVVLKRCR